MRGLWKIHHACNTWHAQQDYADLCAFAVEVGRGDLIDPRPLTESGWGWRRLDKLSQKILSALGADWHSVQNWEQSIGG